MNFVWLRIVVIFMFGILAAACAEPPIDPPPGSEPGAADAPITTPPSMSAPEMIPATQPPAGEAQSAPAESTPAGPTQAEIEQLVLADLSARHGLAPSEARIVASDLRRWPDPGLGCNARPGVFEPLPTPGYLIQIEANGQSYEYHTDLNGNFILCPTISKPLGPIK